MTMMSFAALCKLRGNFLSTRRKVCWCAWWSQPLMTTHFKYGAQIQAVNNSHTQQREQHFKGRAASTGLESCNEMMGEGSRHQLSAYHWPRHLTASWRTSRFRSSREGNNDRTTPFANGRIWRIEWARRSLQSCNCVPCVLAMSWVLQGSEAH